MEEKWDIVITNRSKLFNIDFKELWRYRDLVFMYVKRDFITFYKQTILGPIWYFIQPVFTTIMFMFVFGGIAGISTDGVPQAVFYMGGLVCWNYFADCFNRSCNIFNTNKGIFGKVYFPRLVVPLAGVISNLIKFGIQFSLFLAVYLYFVIAKGIHFDFNATVLLVPVYIIMLAALGLGLGMLFSSLTIKYRDLNFVVSFGLSLLMYATPVIYPLSVLKESHAKYFNFLLVNPLTSIHEAFKFAFTGVGVFNWLYLLYSLVFTIVVFIWGLVVFNRVQRNFMDVI